MTIFLLDTDMLSLHQRNQSRVIAAVDSHSRDHLKPHWDGYLLGLKQTLRLYVPIALLLAIAAVYDVFDMSI